MSEQYIRVESRIPASDIPAPVIGEHWQNVRYDPTHPRAWLHYPLFWLLGKLSVTHSFEAVTYEVIDKQEIRDTLMEQYCAYWDRYGQSPEHVYMGRDEFNNFCTMPSFSMQVDFAHNETWKWREVKVTIVPHMRGVLMV